MMRFVFINSKSIFYPDFFTRYYNVNGESYQRIESAVNSNSFDKDADVIKIELYQNSADEESEPLIIKVIYR